VARSIFFFIGNVQTQGINIAWRLAGAASFHAIAAGAFKILFFSVPSRFICNPTGRKLGFVRILVSMLCAICGWVARRCCGGSSQVGFKKDRGSLPCFLSFTERQKVSAVSLSLKRNIQPNSLNNA